MEPVAPPAAAPLTWSRNRKRLVTALLLWHLAALVVAAGAVGPSSLFFEQSWQVFRPYLQATYLNHGYHFFAPEPGPSHLIRYEIVQPSGHIVGGYFPNAQQHSPRLLYHRHFMLSEHLNGHIETDATPELVHSYARSYAAHLLHTQQGSEIKLWLLRHRFPSPGEVLEGKPLHDASLFAERSLGTFRQTETGLLAEFSLDLREDNPAESRDTPELMSTAPRWTNQPATRLR